MLAETLDRPLNYLPKPDVWSPVQQTRLPTMYDLPYEGPEDGMPDRFHVIQPQLLSETFCPPTYPETQVLTATDLYVYYDLAHLHWYKRPDWFAVLGVPREQRLQELRFSYVIWQERVVPYLIVELLSPGTEKEDLEDHPRRSGQPPCKWEVYERILKVPYYAIYSRYTLSLQVFALVAGRYQEVPLQGPGVWLPTAQMGLGLWSGEYQGVTGDWLRFFDAQRNWIPTEAERRQTAEQRAHSAEQEVQRAEQRAQTEAQARLALEAEIVRLKALLEN